MFDLESRTQKRSHPKANHFPGMGQAALFTSRASAAGLSRSQADKNGWPQMLVYQGTMIWNVRGCSDT